MFAYCKKSTVFCDDYDGKNKDIIDKVINCSKLLIERDEVNDRG